MPASSTVQHAEQPARFPWLPILVLGFAWFLAVAIELGPAGLLNDIADDLHIGVQAVGTLTTFYALGNALLVLPLTSLAIRFARRTALVAVMVVFVVGNIGVALSPSIVSADVFRFLGGASYGVICTLFPAVAVRIAGPRFAGRAITVVFAATSLGAALGAPIASLTGDAVGWRVVFLVAAGLAAVAGVLMSFSLPRVRERAVHEPLSILQTARLTGVLRVAIAWSLVMLAHFVVLTYVQAYLEDLGAPRILTSVALAVIGLGGIAGTLLVGLVSRRSVYAALVAAPAVVALGFLTIVLASGDLVVLLLGVSLWGIGLSAVVVVYQQTLLLTGRRAPETATSFGVLLAQAGFAIGATTGGLTISVLGITAIPLVALVFVIGSLLIAITLRPAVTASTEDTSSVTAAVAQVVPAGETEVDRTD